jgi:penicillin-binding protein 1A
MRLWNLVKPPERWVAIAGVTVLSIVAVAGFAIAIYAAWLFHDMPDAGDLQDYRPPTATRVYAWDGTLIGEFSRERRIFVPYDQIPARLSQAFLAAEDHSFFQHNGVDMQGMARAMLRNVLNFVRGNRLEGGSTITQQVAKNVLLNSDATVGRKLKEAILARRLEQTLDKPRILELYLNEIWLGYRSFGVGAAAYNYFGKSLNDLSLAQMAYLAALPKGPDNYHPIRRKANALGRRNYILTQMADLGWVTRAEAEAAIREDLVVQSAPSRAAYRDADYFVEEVRRRGFNTLGDRLSEGGYYMRTTLNPTMQTAARVALMNGLESYDRRHGWRGAWGSSAAETGWEAQAEKRPRPAERTGWRPARVESADGAVRVRLSNGEIGNLVSQDVAWARAGKGLKVGDLIFVEPAASGGLRLRQIPNVNGALVAMNPVNGQVLAMVGGYSYSLSNFNRATQALRQPGSSFKPLVYAAALENGFTPASYVTDEAMTFTDSTGKVWTPENYYRRFYGSQPLRRGIELSINGMTVKLAQSVGMRKIVDFAVSLGVVRTMQPVLAMALGAGETTPFAMTAAYASFVNGGRKIEPHLIEIVEDREGKTLLRADKRDCVRCTAVFNGDESPRIAPSGEQVMDPITAFQVTSMLEGAVLRGTGTAARALGRPVGGKTGTTNEYRSAWFVGFTPQIVTGVFIGFDDNRSLGEGETGASAALPVFVEFMKTAIEGQPPLPFVAPKNARFATVNGVREAFRPGSEPRQQDVLPSAPIPYQLLNQTPTAVAPAPEAPPAVVRIPEPASIY